MHNNKMKQMIPFYVEEGSAYAWQM